MSQCAFRVWTHLPHQALVALRPCCFSFSHANLVSDSRTSSPLPTPPQTFAHVVPFCWKVLPLVFV